MESTSYLKLAKELNDELHDELLKKKVHFRGSMNSLSLISLASETAERGVTGIKSKNAAIEKLKTFKVDMPGRNTPEKKLQSWIILAAMRNGGILPFGDGLRFLTSELAFKEKERKIVNDILALNPENDLVVIELKSSRLTKVFDQTIEFQKLIEHEKELFAEIVQTVGGCIWSGKVQKVIVWNDGGKYADKDHKYADIDQYGYIEVNGGYRFEKK